MSKFGLFVIYFLAAVLPSCPIFAQALVEPTEHEVALAGTLKIVHTYGPPGYGEDKKADIQVSYWALDLTFRVTVACTPQLPELKSIQCDSTSRLRLFFPMESDADGLEKEARMLLGHRALVTGLLHRRASMSDYTPVYMDVTDIKAASPK